MRKFRFIILLLTFTFFQFSCSGFEGGTSRSMQQDFDKIRLDHILIISSLVNEYKDKVGHFPFADRSDKPVYVAIATEEQIERDEGRAPVFFDLYTRATEGKMPEQVESVEALTVQEFKAELEKGLQRAVNLPVDPQKVPLNKPTIYFYTYYMEVFDLTAFLHNEFSFTNSLSQFNNKISVGHRSYPQAAIWRPEDLINQEGFREFFQSPFNRGGYTIKTAVN